MKSRSSDAADVAIVAHGDTKDQRSAKGAGVASVKEHAEAFRAGQRLWKRKGGDYRRLGSELADGGDLGRIEKNLSDASVRKPADGRGPFAAAVLEVEHLGGAAIGETFAVSHGGHARCSPAHPIKAASARP